MSFKQYLLAQLGRKDRIGDLAKKMKKKKENTYEDIYAYLYANHASEEEIHALKEAYQEYTSQQV